MEPHPPTMDAIFHASAAVLLAHSLGERRRSHLVAAAVVGVLPDVVWPLLPAPTGSRIMYPWTHTLTTNAPFSLLILFFNWRIAWGNLLHLAIDVVTHDSSTACLFYPFYSLHLPIGISWWYGKGLIIWMLFWVLLILLIIRRWTRTRRPSQPPG